MDFPSNHVFFPGGATNSDFWQLDLENCDQLPENFMRHVGD